LIGLGKTGAIDKLYAFRSTHTRGVLNDPFEQLGQDKLVAVDCLYATSADQWERLGEAAGSVSTARVSPTKSTATIKADTTVPFQKYQNDQAQRSPVIAKTSALSSKSTPLNSPHDDHFALPLSPPAQIKPLSWAEYNPPVTRSTIMPTAQKRSVAPSVVTSGGSLLDQFYHQHSGPSSPSNSGESVIHETETQPSTPKARSYALPSDRNATPTPRSSRPGMTIPFDTSIEGSIGGSPPESDEDEPSVALPHSAVTRIQRATNFVDSDDVSSVGEPVKREPLRSVSRASTQPSPRVSWSQRKEQGYEPSGWGGRGSKGVMAARLSLPGNKGGNSNLVPLGGRDKSRGSRAGYTERRKTSEFKV